MTESDGGGDGGRAPTRRRGDGSGVIDGGRGDRRSRSSASLRHGPFEDGRASARRRRGWRRERQRARVTGGDRRERMERSGRAADALSSRSRSRRDLGVSPERERERVRAVSAGRIRDGPSGRVRDGGFAMERGCIVAVRRVSPADHPLLEGMGEGAEGDDGGRARARRRGDRSGAIESGRGDRRSRSTALPRHRVREDRSAIAPMRPSGAQRREEREARPDSMQAAPQERLHWRWQRVFGLRSGRFVPEDGSIERGADGGRASARRRQGWRRERQRARP